jgi:hypothetical protein
MNTIRKENLVVQKIKITKQIDNQGKICPLKKNHEKRSHGKVMETILLEKIRKGKNKICWWKKSE